MSSSSRSEPAAAPRVVLVLGSELTLRDAALARLREATLASAPRDFNEDRFDLAASAADGRAVLVACRTLPVLSERRLVVVSGLGDRKAQRFVDGPLLDYLDDPTESTTLVLLAEKVDRRMRWVKRARDQGELVDCDGPRKPAEVRDWIVARIEALGKRAGPGTAHALFDLVGNDLDRLSFEIQKACLFVGEAGEISADDVATVTASLRPLAVWALTDAIGKRSLAEALRVLARLDSQGEAPLLVLGALANHFRRLLRAHDCRPLEARRVQQALSLHPFAARKLVEQARRFDAPRARRCLDAVRRADDAVKGAVPLSPAMVLEQLILSVC